MEKEDRVTDRLRLAECYHEAGHAIVAHAYDFRFAELRVPTDDAAYAGAVAERFQWPPITTSRQSFIEVMLAGGCGETMWRQKLGDYSVSRLARYDTRDIGHVLGLTDDEVGDQMEYHLQSVFDLLRAKWRSVNAIATLLEYRQTVPYKLFGEVMWLRSAEIGN